MERVVTNHSEPIQLNTARALHQVSTLLDNQSVYC